MIRVSQQALADVANGLLVAGLTSPPNMARVEEVMQVVRSRLRLVTSGLSEAEQRNSILHVTAPWLEYLTTEHDISGLTDGEATELLWNLFVATASRMQGGDNMPIFTESADRWHEVMAPRFGGGVEPNMTGQPTAGVLFPYKALLIVVVGIVGLCLESWIASGRDRFYVVAVSSLLIAAGFGYFWIQWQPLPIAQTQVERRTSYPSGRREPLIEQTTATVGSSEAPVPAAAPPFPGASQTGSAMVAGSTTAFGVGTRVRVTGANGTLALAGQTGVVSSITAGLYELALDGGLRLSNLTSSSLEMVSEDGTTGPIETSTAYASAGEFYAPLGSTGASSKLQQQAGRLKEALNKAYGMQAMVSSWASLFWQAVKNEADIYGLEPLINKSLQAHGYIGPGTIGPPRYEELKKQLQEIETLGGPHSSTGGMLLRPSNDLEVHDPEQLTWHLRLPPDLQRAAPELYRNIRAEGVSSVRQWVNDQHPTLEQKSSTQYQDLFLAATVIDYELADCRSEQALTHKLATSDSLEIHLRKLGSFIYYRRTKDKTGAQKMLGVRAPGTGADIAPKWMIDDANVHSKAEFQRQERGHKMNKQESYGSGSYSDGGGKGRGKKGGRAGKPGRKVGQPTQG